MKFIRKKLRKKLSQIFRQIRIASGVLSILFPRSASEVSDQLDNSSSGEQGPVTLALLHQTGALPATLQLDRGLLHIPVPQSTHHRATATVRGEILGFLAHLRLQSILPVSLVDDAGGQLAEGVEEVLMRLRSQEIHFIFSEGTHDVLPTPIVRRCQLIFQSVGCHQQLLNLESSGGSSEYASVRTHTRPISEAQTVGDEPLLHGRQTEDHSELGHVCDGEDGWSNRPTGAAHKETDSDVEGTESTALIFANDWVLEEHAVAWRSRRPTKCTAAKACISPFQMMFNHCANRNDQALEWFSQISVREMFSHLPRSLGHFAGSNSIPWKQPTVSHPSQIATIRQSPF